MHDTGPTVIHQVGDLSSVYDGRVNHNESLDKIMGCRREGPIQSASLLLKHLDEEHPAEIPRLRSAVNAFGPRWRLTDSLSGESCYQSHRIE